MCDRQNTLVFSLDIRGPRINSFQIHEWLDENFHIKEDGIRVIQIGGPLRKLYVKFISSESMMRVLQPIQGDVNFHHVNGEISKVKIDIAGVVIRRIRVSTLPSEVTETQITNVMSNYGDIKKIQYEVWSKAYRFIVKSGVRIIDIGIKKRISSHIKVEGHRALISYEGQQITCFRCNGQSHQINECPRRRIPGSHTDHDQKLWANMVNRG